jgi:thiamine kinase-like enzyme
VFHHKNSIAVVPCVLEIHRPTGRTWRQSSPADRELLRIVRATAGFGALLDDLRASWEPLTLIHNDVRWSNCLLPAVQRGQPQRLVLIDWEGAQLGDPCWDVGSALAEYLACWLRSIPYSGGDAPDQFIHLAGFPLEQLQPAMRALWEAWSAHTHLDDAAMATQLHLTTRYAAARLVQNAWEYTRGAETLLPGVALLLQVAFNMLAHPEGAATRLLGLDAGPLEWA